MPVGRRRGSILSKTVYEHPLRKSRSDCQPNSIQLGSSHDTIYTNYQNSEPLAEDRRSHPRFKKNHSAPKGTANDKRRLERRGSSLAARFCHCNEYCALCHRPYDGDTASGANGPWIPEQERLIFMPTTAHHGYSWRQEYDTASMASSLGRQDQSLINAASDTSRSIVVRFFECCTFHGLYEIYTAQHVLLRIFWILAFVCALGASIYGCCAIILAYMSSPVAVSYVVREFEGSSLRPLLPDVVVCPFNRLNASYLRVHNVSQDLTRYIELAFGFSGRLYRFQQEHSAATIGQMTRSQANLDRLLASLGLDFTQFIYEASLRCESFIAYCVSTRGHYNCCQEAEEVMTSVGKCYRIPGTLQSAAGFGFGLTLYMTLPTHLYTPAVNNIHNRGIVVKLVEKGHGLDYDISFLPAGTHALMPVKATQFDFINDPPRYECLGRPVNQAMEYSRVHCFAQCIFGPGQRECNCSHVASEAREYPACTTMQFYHCLIPSVSQTFASNPDRVEMCQRRCKPLCSYWQYSASMSYASIPAPTIRQFLDSDEDYEQLKNTIILDVFYERLEYRLIKHFPTKTLDTFIANLGGQFGLWVGGSILTLFQVMVCLAQLLWQKVTLLANKSQSRCHNSDDHPSGARAKNGRPGGQGGPNTPGSGRRMMALVPCTVDSQYHEVMYKQCNGLMHRSLLEQTL